MPDLGKRKKVAMRRHLAEQTYVSRRTVFHDFDSQDQAAAYGAMPALLDSRIALHDDGATSQLPSTG